MQKGPDMKIRGLFTYGIKSFVHEGHEETRRNKELSETGASERLLRFQSI